MGARSARLRLTRPVPTEADVLATVLARLALYGRQGQVVWHSRMNTGAGRLARRDGTAGQWTRWGFTGCPDILGQLPDGRLLAVEVKRPGGRVRPEQAAFLERARAGGAAAGVVTSLEELERLITLYVA